MIWTQVQIFTSTPGQDPLCAALAEIGITGLVISDPEDFEQFLAGKQGRWDLCDDALLALREAESSVTFYLPQNEYGNAQLAQIDGLLTRLKALDGQGQWGRLEHTLTDIPEESWQDSWKQHWKPTRVGKRLVVCPSWENFQPGAGDVVLRLDPGMAFGTGTHQSTRLCMELAEQIVTGGEQVLDLGCGSGILAITALLLGAEGALGIDIDDVAVRVCTENAAMNGLEQRAGFRKGDLARGIDGQYQLIFANIIADVILKLLPDVPRLLAPGGWLIASGILSERAGEIESALGRLGLRVERKLENEGWCALLVAAN